MTATPRLQEPLERLYREFDWAARADLDAIRFPLRYPGRADREVVALLASCMAYGRVDLFGPWVDWALARMGESPARFVLGFDPAKHAARFEDFRYRFNRPRDLAAFCLATQRVLIRHGSLGAAFRAGFSPGDAHVGPALERFVDAFLTQDLSAVFPRNRLSYGYRHWFPRPVHRRRVQADAALSPVDGAPGGARLRALDRDPARRAPDPGGHPHREHGPVARSHPAAQPELEDDGGDHERAAPPRPGRSGEVRLLALPHPDVRPVPRPPRRDRVRPVPAAAGVPPLARPTERGAVTAGWVWVVVAALALLLGVTAWALWRAVARLGALETARQQPDQALLLLQRDIQTARAEAHQARSETLATVKEELHQFASHMTQQMGQVGSGVQQQLQHVGQVVGAVQGSLGKLGEVTQRVFDVGRDIAGLEQLLKSPKIRGGVGETLLENLLAQMLPREQYSLQHAFATGDRVDAAIRIGERIVPVDAKFPLENFRRVLEETDEDKRGPLRRAFLRDVKNRVDEIAKKYILPDEGTFDFALMYIPAENIYYEIIVRDDSEEDSPAAYALARRVVPVSPNTFYAYLRVIVLGLRGLRIERDAQEIQARLGRLRGDLDKFREAFDVVGRHLTNARNKYDDAASGLGRLEGKLEGIERHGEQGALPGIAP